MPSQTCFWPPAVFHKQARTQQKMGHTHSDPPSRYVWGVRFEAWISILCTHACLGRAFAPLEGRKATVARFLNYFKLPVIPKIHIASKSWLFLPRLLVCTAMALPRFRVSAATGNDDTGLFSCSSTPSARSPLQRLTYCESLYRCMHVC